MIYYGVKTQGVYTIPPKSLKHKMKEFISFYDAYRFAYNKNADIYEVYVDASSAIKKNKAAYAFLIRRNGTVIYEDAKCIYFNKLKNSAYAELYAVIKALNFCQKNKFNNIVLYYDFDGVEKFARDEFYGRRNNCEFIERYKRIVNDNTLNINFSKIKAHSGHHYNNRVDKLAKELIRG